MATATNLGPVGIGQINNVFYVGGDGGFDSIQEALNYVQKYNAGVGEIVIVHGYPTTEQIGNLTGGSDTTYLSDQRDTKIQNWNWSDTLGQFVPADFVQLSNGWFGGLLKGYGFEAPDMVASHVSIGTGGGSNTQVAAITMVNVSAPVDQRMWLIAAYPDQLIFSSAEDTGPEWFWMRALRTGPQVTEVLITPPLSVTGGVTSQGSPVRTFANTPDNPGGGGGTGSGTVNPGASGALPFYPSGTALVSSSQITTDVNTQTMLTVPGMVKAYGYEVPSMTASHVSIGSGGAGANQVPVVTFINASNPVDQRMWIIAALSDRLYFSSEKDDGTDNPWMQAMRGTGNAVSSVIITPPLTAPGGVTSQGSPVRTFANTPTGGGGVNPGTANVLSFYPAAGSTVSPSQITTDAATQKTLTVPTSLSTYQVNATLVYTNNVNTGNMNDRNSSNWEYIQESTTTTVAGAGHNVTGTWAGTYNGYDVAYSAQRGIAQLRGGFIERFAVGDTTGIYFYNRSVGGVACGADEGCSGATFSCYEFDQGYFQGTVNTTTGLGDQAPTWTWTPNTGKDITIDGAFMLNITKGQLQGNWNGTGSPPSTQLVLTTATGTLPNSPPGTQYTFLWQLKTTAISFPAGSVPAWSATVNYGAGNIVSLSGTNYVCLVANVGRNPPTNPQGWEVLPAGQLPISTAIGIVDSASLPIPDPNVAPNNPVEITLTVNLAQLRGTYPPFAVGDVVSLVGNWRVEQTRIDGATMIGTQQQSLTMKLRNANGQAILFKGGIQGQYISMDANLPFSGMRSSYYACGSLDGISLIYAVNVAGSIGPVQLPQLGCEPATASGTGSGFHLYPGAEIVCNPTYGHTGTLEQNGVRWEPGDNVENPHYPVYGGSGLFVNKQQITPANAGYGSQGFFMLVGGKGFCGGGAVAMWIRSNEPDTNFYAAGAVGSSVQAPGGLLLSGFYNWGLYMSNAPQPTGHACLAIGAAADPKNKNNNANAVVKIVDVEYSTPGKLNYDPAAGQWNCSGAFSAGNIIAGGGLSVGGGASLLSGQVVFSATNDYATIAFPGTYGRGTQSITANYLSSTINFVTLWGGGFNFQMPDSSDLVTINSSALTANVPVNATALAATGNASTGTVTAPGGLFASTNATLQGAGLTNAMFQQNAYWDGTTDHFVDTTKVAARVMLSGNTLLFQISPAGSAPVWQTLFSIDATGNVKSLGTMTPSTTP